MSRPTLLTRGNLQIEGEENTIPINYIMNWFRKRIVSTTPPTLSDRVLIIKSKTGSGKSTVLPTNIFRLLRPESSKTKYMGKSVICTQPRVLTAITLAHDLDKSPHYPDMKMGSTIGYQTGPKSNKPPNGLIYATAGILLVQLRLEVDICAKYAFIIIDEAHERSLDTDGILMRLKSFITEKLDYGGIIAMNTPFIILTSATIDTQKYADYFGIGQDNIINVSGRQFPIETVWPATGCNDFIKEAANRITEIHQQNPQEANSDILVFMPGMGEIKELEAILIKINDKLALLGFPLLLVLIIDRETINQEKAHYQMLKAPAVDLRIINNLTNKEETPSRRIILSTVVAETGITIETLKYVIDAGWSRNMETYQPMNIGGLITRPAPQSRIEQRKGRVGRLAPGIFYPLYTQKAFNQLTSQQYPEIIIEGPGTIFLDMVQNQKQDFFLNKIAMLDPPAIEGLASSINIALWTGMLTITNSEYALTELGKLAVKFNRTSMQEVRFLCGAYVMGVSLLDVITAISIINVCDRGIKGFYINKNKITHSLMRLGVPKYLNIASESDKVFYDRIRLLIADDVIEGIFMFNGFVTAACGNFGDMEKWGAEHNINIDTIYAIISKREEIIEEMLTIGMNPFVNVDRGFMKTPPEDFLGRIKAFKQCIYEAYRENLLINATSMYGQKVKMRSTAKYIVTPKINILTVRTSGKALLQWGIEALLLCTLDGFVDIDPEILHPRRIKQLDI